VTRTRQRENAEFSPALTLRCFRLAPPLAEDCRESRPGVSSGSSGGILRNNLDTKEGQPNATRRVMPAPELLTTHEGRPDVNTQRLQSPKTILDLLINDYDTDNTGMVRGHTPNQQKSRLCDGIIPALGLLGDRASLRGGPVAGRRPHKPKNAGSIPAPATTSPMPHATAMGSRVRRDTSAEVIKPELTPSKREAHPFSCGHPQLFENIEEFTGHKLTPVR
jgi:hypothetical protein